MVGATVGVGFGKDVLEAAEVEGAAVLGGGCEPPFRASAFATTEASMSCRSSPTGPA